MVYAVVMEIEIIGRRTWTEPTLLTFSRGLGGNLDGLSSFDLRGVGKSPCFPFRLQLLFVTLRGLV